MRLLIMIAALVALLGCGSARPPLTPSLPVEPDTTERVAWDWEDGFSFSYFSIQVSNQIDPALTDEWSEIARSDQVPTDDNPVIVDFPDRPIFVLVRAVCDDGDQSKPSNVVEVK